MTYIPNACYQMSELQRSYRSAVVATECNVVNTPYCHDAGLQVAMQAWSLRYTMKLNEDRQAGHVSAISKWVMPICCIESTHALGYWAGMSLISMQAEPKNVHICIYAVDIPVPALGRLPAAAYCESRSKPVPSCS